MAVLTLMFNGKQLQSFPIGMGDSFVIGRHPVNDIVIDNLAVSFQHAKIESIGDEYLLIDLKSENGSFVNDQRVKAHWLTDSDAITIGKHTLLFSNPKNGNLPEKISASIIETMQMDTEKFRALLKKNGIDVNKIEVSHKPGAPIEETPTALLSVLSDTKRDLPLGEKPVRIGKALTSDIVVKGFGVASTAAVINRIGDGWHISYVGGWARVKVNNQSVKTSVKLNRLDIIRLSRLKMQFLAGSGS